MNDSYESLRERMVEFHIRSRGIHDPRILGAMRKVPRHEFVSPSQAGSAYADGPLPIGKGQTISQPYIVAYMTNLLELTGTETVLELGTGCGYQTAILAELAAHVYTIEVIESLSKEAEERLKSMNYSNISFLVGNGRNGWSDSAPYDRIILTAAPVRFPENLFAQLGDKGIAIAPVGDYFQRLMRYRKKDDKVNEEALVGVSFVPFV